MCFFDEMDENSHGILPEDIMINILKRVPVKSLTRFKCVSKHWFNLFKTPFFVAQQLHYSVHCNPLLLLQRIPRPYHESYSSTYSSCLIGSDSTVHNPDFIEFATPSRIVGSCNGLLCVRDNDHTLSVLNPATRETQEVPGTLIDVNSFHYVGFGFSPALNDYKIVRISVSEFDEEDQVVEYNQVVIVDDVHVNRAEVYSLNMGFWKEIDASNLQNLNLVSRSVTANGAMFWLASLASDLDDPNAEEFVVSFDVGCETFTLLKGPPLPPCYNTVLTVYNNKLAMFHHSISGSFDSSSIDLWVLKETHTCAVRESWVKQYSVGPFPKILYPLDIWRDEIVCREELPWQVDENGMGQLETVLCLFNPYTNELKNLPSQTNECYYASFIYAESLVPIGNIHHEQ